MQTANWQLDWDEALDNMQGRNPQTLMQSWQDMSEEFKARWAMLGEIQTDIVYGEHPRERYDMFRPSTECRGIVVLIHGGYWMRTGREYWSFLAEGILKNGWAVAIPSYPLAPEVRISSITRSITLAVETIASHTTGALRLAGHSAGGHLVSRLVCRHMLASDTVMRIEKAVSVSGVHDLRPLLHTKMNDILKLSLPEAETESSIFLVPENIPFICWVGAHERAEFLRQNRLLHEAWSAESVSAPPPEAFYDNGHDHFSVIEQLQDFNSPLTRMLTE